MAHDDHPARANIRYLEQGVALIGRLADAQYAGSPQGPFAGGVGAQFRHCLDFYGNIGPPRIAGLPTGDHFFGSQQLVGIVERKEFEG